MKKLYIHFKVKYIIFAKLISLFLSTSKNFSKLKKSTPPFFHSADFSLFIKRNFFEWLVVIDWHTFFCFYSRSYIMKQYSDLKYMNLSFLYTLFTL